MRASHCIAFVGNIAALDALIWSSSKFLRLKFPLHEGVVVHTVFAELDSEVQMMIWFERAPSTSNVADDPSRLRPVVAPQGWESTEVEVFGLMLGGVPFFLGCRVEWP
eukprot:6476908-Amphidinium_carterae.1